MQNALALRSVTPLRSRPRPAAVTAVAAVRTQYLGGEQHGNTPRPASSLAPQPTGGMRAWLPASALRPAALVCPGDQHHSVVGNDLSPCVPNLDVSAVAGAISAIAGVGAGLVASIVASNNETDRARIRSATEQFIANLQHQMAGEHDAAALATLNLQLRQAEALERALAPKGMSTGTLIALGVGGVALLGGVAYFALRAGRSGGARAPGASAPSLDTVKSVGWDMVTLGGSGFLAAVVTGMVVGVLHAPPRLLPDNAEGNEALLRGYTRTTAWWFLAGGFGLGVLARGYDAPASVQMGATAGPVTMGLVMLYSSYRADARAMP